MLWLYPVEWQQLSTWEAINSMQLRHMASMPDTAAAAYEDKSLVDKASLLPSVSVASLTTAAATLP